LPLRVEGLEDRTMPAAIPLTGPNGGAWVKIDTLTVSTRTNQTVATGVQSNVALELGRSYLVVALGTARIAADSTGYTDPEYIRYNKSTGPQDGSSPGYAWNNHGVRLDGVAGGTTTGNFWGTYQSDHVYTQLVEGQGTLLRGWSSDLPGYYGDNSGTLQIDLYAEVPEGTGIIGGLAWHDFSTPAASGNGDGIRQRDEPTLPGISVTLLDEYGREIAHSVTNSEGSYRFATPYLDTYFIRFSLPWGKQFTFQQSGTDAHSDSDADPFIGISSAVELGPNVLAVLNVSAGYVLIEPPLASPPVGKTPQERAYLGVKAVATTDEAGPNATRWFAEDIYDQIKHRGSELAKFKKTLDGLDMLRAAGVPKAVLAPAALSAAKDDLLSFREQAKYFMAPKWIDFGTPKVGKGVNTVVLAGNAMRKNQLGNIEFGLISWLQPPPATLQVSPVGIAYRTEDVKTYFGKHPYAKEVFGEQFTGVYRADNGAAFGVGAAIAENLLKPENLKVLNEGTPKQAVDLIEKIIRDLFKPDQMGDPALLRTATNRYAKMFGAASKTNVSDINYRSLFIAPTSDGSGFNTTSLDVTGSQQYQGKSSRAYFADALKPAYDQYKAANSDALSLDDWLQVYHENFTVATQKN
jgi:hypothetical protein